MMNAADDVPGHNKLIDRMDEGVNELYCECGARILPDCDMSCMSIVEEFDRHRSGVGG